MAVTVYTEDELFNRALNYFRLAFPSQDLSEYSFLVVCACVRSFLCLRKRRYTRQTQIACQRIRPTQTAFLGRDAQPKRSTLGCLCLVCRLAFLVCTDDDPQR